jgi:hypothetical protein
MLNLVRYLSRYETFFGPDTHAIAGQSPERAVEHAAFTNGTAVAPVTIEDDTPDGDGNPLPTCESFHLRVIPRTD